MLFNSHIYLFIFLPLACLIYFTLNRSHKTTLSKFWLIFCSLFFYGFWAPRYIVLIIISVVINYSFGRVLCKYSRKRIVLTAGVLFNLGLLGYFKYADFILANLNQAVGTAFPYQNIVLPLAISFFTFQQIAYLVDSSKGLAREYDFLNYLLFVTFFPQLIAGPIVHHKEMMPQFTRLRNKVLSYSNLVRGMFLIAIGLTKKAVIADMFGAWANQGFDSIGTLTMAEGWAASLSYTFQIYFDFSGYTDMAIGSACLFNIRLPINFSSPYQAVNIRDFWQRWHITLSRWLKEYIYIPLGGNRKGELRTCVNLLLTFLIGGIWHGAGWTFAIWGILHGTALLICRLFGKLGFSLPRGPAWLLTFLFVNFTWVFFRAANFEVAAKILKAMLGFNGIDFSYYSFFPSVGAPVFAFLIILVFALLARPQNSNCYRSEITLSWNTVLRFGLLFLISFLMLGGPSEFIYFQF